MKAIILAAGEGSRLRPLTNTTPKPLIKILGKTILEHNLESIYSHVSEIILVVKYKQEMFREYFGSSYKGVPISYKFQGEENGTAAALWGLNSSRDILIINGDTIFGKPDLENIIHFSGNAVLVQKVENPSAYGIFKLDSDENVMQVIEKPTSDIGNLASLGVFKISGKLLDLAQNINVSPRGEYELTDAINLFVKDEPLKTMLIQEDFIDISYPWDILNAHKYFLSNLKRTEISGEIEEGVTINGNIILEEGAILKSGTYIEGNVYIGKNSKIGPNTYLRNGTVIGQGCRVGNAVELKNTTLGDNSNIAHLSYIGDSVLGNNINIGGGFIAAPLRHDNKNIRVMVKGKLIDTGLRKFGIIIGDNVKTGIQASSMPGRMLDNDSMVLPGECIK